MAGNKETSIGIKLVADLRSYQQGMAKAQTETKKFSNNVKRNMGDVKGAFQGLMAGDITALPTFFKSATTAAGGFSKGLQGVKVALISTGIGALLVALGTAIAAVIQYFKGTEEGQIVWMKVMNGIKTVTEPVLQMFGRFGKALVQLFSGDFKGAWETAKGAVNGVGDAIRNNINNLGELNTLEEKLITTRRTAAREEKRLLAEISELRNKANDEENYSAQQRAAFINQALNKQNELSKIRNGLAEDELKLAQLKADQGDNDIETNNQLAELEDRRLEIQKQNSDESRRMLETQQRINKEVKIEVAERQRIADQIAERANNASVQTIRTRQVTTLETGQADTSTLQDMGNYLDANTQKLNNFRTALQETMSLDEQIQSMSGSFATLGTAIGGTTGSFLGMASTLLGLIPQLISQIAALTTAQVASSGAVTAAKSTEAVAAGTAASQSVPFPLNLIALAATIAAVVKALATKPKAFAAGGIVYGNTIAQVGEYAGARTNPEVIAPLNKLKGILGEQQNGGVQILQPSVNIDAEGIQIMLNKVQRRQNKRT